MKAYFSGTDNEELQDNTPNHKMYLSLIVNYNEGGKYVARLCCKASEKVLLSDIIKDLNFTNGKSPLNASDYYVEKDCIFYIDIPVLYDLDDVSINRYDRLIKAKKDSEIYSNRSVFPTIGRTYQQTHNRFASWSRNSESPFLEDVADNQLDLFDTPILGIDDELPRQLVFSQEKIVDFLYYLLTLDLDKPTSAIGLKDLTEVCRNINTVYSKTQLAEIEENLKNFTEHVAELAYNTDFKTAICLEDEEIYEFAEKAKEFLDKNYMKYHKVIELFENHLLFLKEYYLDSTIN